MLVQTFSASTLNLIRKYNLNAISKNIHNVNKIYANYKLFF